MPEAPYRVAASCGVAFTVLMVAAASVVPTAPQYNSGPSMAMTVALLCAAIAIVRWHLFPSWLALAATLAAALSLIDNVSDLATSGTRLGPLGLIAFATVNIWIIGTALTGIRARTTSQNAVAYRQAEPGAS